MRFIRYAAALLVTLALTLLTGPLAWAATAQSPTPCGNVAKACIDLSANRAWLMNHGVVSYGPVPITSGKRGYATPPGMFRVTFKDIDHRSREYHNAPMPYSVFFNGGIAFHEGSLRRQSHGCIHLSHTAAKRFYHDLVPGDPVEVRP